MSPNARNAVQCRIIIDIVALEAFDNVKPLTDSDTAISVYLYYIFYILTFSKHMS